MFESAALSHVLDKVEYKKQEPLLRTELLEAQFAFVEKKTFPVVVVIAGNDGAGKAACVRKLYEWLDPHHLETHAFWTPTEEERMRPRMWRYWQALPPKGKIGFLFGSWYHQPLHDRILNRISPVEFERELQVIDNFESMLAAEGALILKFWLHIARAERGAQNKKKGKKEHQPKGEFEEWGDISHDDYERSVEAAEMMARITSTGYAPWIVVPSNDHRFRDLTIGQTILEALRKRLDCQQSLVSVSAPAVLTSLDRRNVLNGMDLSQKLTVAEYEQQLARYQLKLSRLTEHKTFEKIAVVSIFEGNDAAGKGSVIRRVSQGLDPRRFQAHATAAPTDEEKAQPYLWRFWRRLPRRGHFASFDRSWYGRVLVERIEGFCSEAEWLRAYNEINDFELQMTEAGFVVAKFWLAVSKQEQLNRFRDREKTDFKRFKITDEDWRNRHKWDDYAIAVGDMVDRTSTRYAPWTLVEAEDKLFARVKVLKTLCERIGAMIG